MDLVGADIVGAIFDRCRLRHPAHSKFARNIGKAWKSIVGDQPGDRRYVYDGALPGLEHRRDHRVHAEIDAVLIDRADMHVIGFCYVGRPGHWSQYTVVVDKTSHRLATVFCDRSDTLPG